jgi:hypothetical protein
MVPLKQPEVTPVTLLSKRSMVKLPVAPANRPVPPVMMFVSNLITFCFLIVGLMKGKRPFNHSCAVGAGIVSLTSNSFFVGRTV